MVMCTIILLCELYHIGSVWQFCYVVVCTTYVALCATYIGMCAPLILGIATWVVCPKVVVW